MPYHNAPIRFHKGKVLVAQAALLDPNFKQTLILLTEHNKHGAFGFIMNRPTEQMANGMLPKQAAFENLSDMPICFGGPVQNESVIFAAFKHSDASSPISIRAGIGGDELKVALLDKTQCVKAFMGYAGWSEGQLEAELAQEAWKVAEPSPALFTPEYSQGIWNAYASGDERWKKLLPHLPKNPEKN